MDWILSKIRDYRKAKGYSQEELADILGIEQKTYSNWERGRTEMTLQNLTKIADALEIDRKELWDESKWISKPYKAETKSTPAEEPSFIYGKMANVPAECQKIVDKLESEIVILREQNLALTRAFNELFESKKTKTLTA